ncbi:MAG TPA: NUDIX domain-containing protein [Puia sp.]|nr:NUDIX domain-containing protein [Puia sp.]
MTRVLAAGGLVFNENNELLLIFRYGKWDLPKGHFEPPETLDTCALREVREETGIKELTIISFVGITEHGYFDNKLNIDALKETHWFSMRASRRDELFPQLQEGIEWLRWVTVGELPQYLRNSYENIRQIVEKCLLQRKIS